MALIKCPECKKEISDRVKACPHCGYPMLDDDGIIQKVEVSSVNLKSKNPKMRKKVIIIISIVLAVLILATGSLIVVNNINERKAEVEAAEQARLAYNKYIDDLNNLVLFSLSGGAEAEKLCNLTHSVWYDAVFKEYDSETKEYVWKVNYGYYDFNTALANLYSDDETIETIANIEANQTIVESYMKELSNPPETLEYCYQVAMEMYAAYQGLTELAINPKGSLQSYVETKNEKIDAFLTQYNKLETMIPEKREAE